MELNDENIITVLEELLPYIEADGGWLEYVETEGNYVKVRLGGACASWRGPPASQGPRGTAAGSPPS